MNRLGYRLLGQGKTDDAIEVFLVNVELFPESWNAWDSLGEAYMTRGNKELAKNYEKSLELNPQNDGAHEALKKLKAAEQGVPPSPLSRKTSSWKTLLESCRLRIDRP